MKPGDFFDFVPLERPRLRLTTALDLAIGIGSVAVLAAWMAGQPLLYSAAAPVMSPFTALSLGIMVSVRQARLHLETWPMVLGLAMIGLVLGGNVSSMLMLATTPPSLWASFPNLVLTSVMTSIGLVCFCAYELVVSMRKTPETAFIVDDLLIHLALVPGGLSLLGYLLGNPTYLSIHADPRVGISLLEMGFLAAYAVAAVVSNPDLFLWTFLRARWSNRVVFGLLFLNQFVAPLVVALLVSTAGTPNPGVEFFVMLAGIVTTVSFLVLQARLMHRAGPPQRAMST